MANEKPSLKRKLTHAAGWKVIRTAARFVPPVGTVLAVGFVGYDIKKKGLVKGIVNAGLDAIPLVGAGKNLVEIFTGDLLPDKDRAKVAKKLPQDGRRQKKENHDL